MAQRARKLKKVQAKKKLMKSKKSKNNVYMKLNFWQFETFSQFKNWYLAIFEIEKNGIWSKNFFREIDFFDFMIFFGLDF